MTFRVHALGGKRKAAAGWSYATIAAAESSGDSWVDGDDIEITADGGFTMKYLSALAANSYSGLIHKHPWDGTGTLGTLSAITLTSSTERNIDPDSWTDSDWTPSGNPNTNAGRSRFLAGDTLNHTNVASGVTEAFLIIVNNQHFTSFTPTSNTQVINGIRVAAYSTSSLTYYIQIISRILSTGVVRWEDQGGGIIDTDAETEKHTYMYVKDGRWAIWFEDQATPASSGATPSSTGLQGQARMVGITTAGNNWWQLTQLLTGHMTIS